MSTSRDFPFSFSVEARSVLGPPDTLNLAVRAAFPELEAAWTGRTATYCRDGMAGRAVVTRAGSFAPANTVLGLFAGTVYMGSEPRSLTVLPLPAFRVNGVEVHCFVDGAARAARRPSAGEAVLYRHTCDDEVASLVGHWWLGGPVPCLLARAADDLSEFATLSWNFDHHGAVRYTLSQTEARLWRRAGHRTQRCYCNMRRDCLSDRFLRVAGDPSSSNDSDG
jgi:hypothetical protein